MKYIVSALIVFIIGIGTFLLFGDGQEDTSPDMSEIADDPVSVTPISHASAVLGWGDTVVYADPVGGGAAYANQPTPDAIFITHTHGDHFDQETLQAVAASSTQLVVPQTVADQLPDTFSEQTHIMDNGETRTVAGLSVDAVPMYNIPQTDDVYHAKGDGNGYVIERDGYRVYIAGDTSGTPEMRALASIDMAFVPMNLPYTMDVEEAADAVLDFSPAVVYPYHYRGQDGLSDVDRFQQLVEEDSDEIDVRLPDWYPDRQESAS